MLHHDTYIDGVKFRPEGERELAKLPQGTMLALEPEPTNRHDRNAVKVISPGGVHIGYVPKVWSAEIADLIKQGRARGATLAGGRTIIRIHFVEAAA